MLRKVLSRAVVFLVCLLLLGCAGIRGSGSASDRLRDRKGSVRLSELAAVGQPHRESSVSINRKDYLEALGKRGLLRRVRIVEVFAKAEDSGKVPEYRFFDIHPESAYALLGLANADILMAADDYVVFDPDQFRAYVEVVAKQPGGFIQVRRAGEVLVLRFRFVDEAETQS